MNKNFKSAIVYSLYIGVLFGAILALFGFNQLYANYITNDESVVYTFLADDNYPPYTYEEDGRPVGFCVDLMYRIADLMDIKVEIKTGSWDDVRHAVENGEADGLLAMFYSAERDKILDFSIPHSTVIHAIFVHDKSPVRSKEDLSDRTIVVQKGDIMHDYLLNNKISNSIITVENAEDAVLLLSHGAYDCALLSKMQGDFFINSYKLDNIRSLSEFFSPREYCFAVNNNPKLLNLLNEGLIILQSNGEHKALFQEWLDVSESPKLFTSIFFKQIISVIIILILIIMLTVIWVWLLRKTVSLKTLELKEEIQNRKQIEKTLRGSEENFRSLADNAFDGILISDINGNYIYANNNAAEITGHPVSVLLKLNVKDLTPSDHYDEVIGVSKQRIQGKSVRSFYESLLQRKDGTIIPIEIVASKTTWHNEPADLVFIRDISLRKQMERALQSSETNFRQIVEHSNDAIYVRQNEIFVLVNHALEKLLEYNRTELLDKNFDFLTIVDNVSKGQIRERFEKRKQRKRVSKQFEFTACTKSGKILELEVNTSKIVWDGKPASLGIIRDLTRYKRLQEEVFKAEKLNSIGVLAGGIAHDFNNILSVLLGNVELTKLKIGKGEDIEKYLIRLEETISQATGLTQQLLTFSKGGEPVIKVASIKDLMLDVVPFILTGSNIKSEISIEDDLHLVKMDANQISQVLTNIVINAKQAMPDGGKLSVEALNVIIESGDLIDNLDAGEYVKVSITDQGIGISEKIIDKIFDPFFSTKSFGSGLGLATCYSIILRHKGHIAVSSVAGEGTTFTIYLPGTDKELIKKQAVKINKAFHGHVLLMDDEDSVREFMNALLMEFGFTVDYTVDGKSTINIFKQTVESGSRYDLVILDLTIPGGKGGKEVLKDLIAIDPEVVALAYSGYADDPVISHPREYGFKASFSKPFDIDKLVAVISSVI
ncbi:MAG: PAS domain S-box protein [Candidatus Marinimicrobia bacterium]|nr:PAS domain S-box protein [Candidatus Neomarinimicrobiota bacterium]